MGELPGPFLKAVGECLTSREIAVLRAVSVHHSVVVTVADEFTAWWAEQRGKFYWYLSIRQGELRAAKTYVSR